MNNHVYPGKLQPHARLYISNRYVGLNLPWSDTMDTIKRVMANRKLQELEEPERSLAYVAVGFYESVRRGLEL